MTRRASRWKAPPVHLDPKRALALGMGFHELATNAAKYGAFVDAGRHGACAAGRSMPDGKILKLRWEERGGPAVVAPQRRGFGLRLIEHGLGARTVGRGEAGFRARRAGVRMDDETECLRGLAMSARAC